MQNKLNRLYAMKVELDYPDVKWEQGKVTVRCSCGWNKAIVCYFPVDYTVTRDLAHLFTNHVWEVHNEV